jgi:hypothetical protein
VKKLELWLFIKDGVVVDCTMATDVDKADEYFMSRWQKWLEREQKGRDVDLVVGICAASDYVVVHEEIEEEQAEPQRTGWPYGGDSNG